jgi:hypothetical protein
MGKNFTLVLAICLLLICINGCSTNDATEPTTKPAISSDQNYKNPDAKVTFLEEGFWCISVSYLGESELADRIIAALQTMKETGEISQKISDDVMKVDDQRSQTHVEIGTLWIEIEDKIYRMNSDYSQICLVETHYGEGKVLAITEEFKTAVYGACNYYPYDYYLGEYHQGDETVVLNHVFEADSTVKLSIKNIKIENDYHSQNTVTIEFTSSIDQVIKINYRSQQSPDNLYSWGDEIVALKKDVPTTLELIFTGSKYSYRLYLTADNTKVEIRVDP